MAPLDTKPATLAQLAKAIEAASFQNMGLFPDAVAAIRATLGERAKPTPVQALAIPASLAMGGKHGQRALLVGAETGGGKTLAYLLPLITRLKTAETVAQEAVPSVDDTVDAVVSSSESNSVFVSASKLRRLRRPRAIILVPSRDLVAQVTEVAKSLCSHHVRLTVLGIHARQAHPERLAAKLASTPIDILVTTPHELKKHLSQNTLALSKLTEVVVDESDTLFDDSNSDDLQEIQHAIRSHIPTASVTTVDEAHDSISNEAAPKESPPLLPLTTYISATFPVSMTSKIAAMHPEGYTQIATPRLHRPLPGLKQMFLSVTSSSTKQNLLLDVLKRSSQSGEKRVIIFVNSRDTGTWLCDFLRGKKVVAPGAGAVFLANGEMEGKMRDAVLGLYKEGKKNVISKSEQTLLEAAAVFGTSSSIDTQGTDGEKLPWSERLVILVATDVASRGVDTTAADHIILYDFPRSSIEYLHRVGRTARNGGKGRATSLLTNRDRRVADEIELAVRRGNVLC
ncbi:P-loop containing nucleoside triphosphate hydrolase protein [Obelidium mucronatum]|nr:P-loop containing nucleoside triphosphate hydrolase protein [Obelidium mucronatum]